MRVALLKYEAILNERFKMITTTAPVEDEVIPQSVEKAPNIPKKRGRKKKAPSKKGKVSQAPVLPSYSQ